MDVFKGVLFVQLVLEQEQAHEYSCDCYKFHIRPFLLFFGDRQLAENDRQHSHRRSSRLGG